MAEPADTGSPGWRLPPDVDAVVAAVLQDGHLVSPSYFAHPRLGLVYRAFVIAQVLDPVMQTPQALALSGELPGRVAAGILSRFGLTGPGSEDWVQVYEHLGGVVAAAVTIARRMRLDVAMRRTIRSAALLHDAAKRRDVERHGPLASSLANEGPELTTAMRAAGYPAGTIRAAVNTGRQDRVFSDETARRQSITGKGIAAAVVALADARCIGGQFCSLDEAQADYLARKADAESQHYFRFHWRRYYDSVQAYLTAQAPWLRLDLTPADIYRDTVLPEVLGLRSTLADRERFALDGRRG